MAALKPYNKYKEQSIMSASRGELTLMLYNGCIRFIIKAKKMIDEGNIPGAHESNIRAQLIIEEFMSTLNMDYEISKRLFAIYEYLHSRLVEANIKKSNEILDEVLGFITDLRNNWEEAIKIAGNNII